MKLVQRIFGILNRPFPEDESRFGSPKIIAIVSIFIVFFLFVFQPFGISSLGSDRFLVCLGFGAMTFIATILYEYIVSQVLHLKGNHRQWTFWKWLVNNLGIMLSISLANFLFARLVLFGTIEWSLFPDMLYGTFMIGIIPFTALGAWFMLVHEKRYQGIADEINLHAQVPAQGNKEGGGLIFAIPYDRIKYAEALQNYVKIGHITEKGEFALRTERTTLKDLLANVQGSPIIQCHRSFLVNRNAIKSVTGNAQGLSLTLSDCDLLVPVSRSYVPLFREK